ncbi:MAG TPA: L-threonylcarbamoyladenylate synthase [Candidatus Magasanikbacteria bacterium]|jgi:L-threonylcarbamoyladenylate synthase|nr:threonylcarbamoyl-AMP synthase [Candidatus Magasanikbacteria bacterium]HQF57024.1 L-threonylcarbamoyladenylate synthase [Candidatus Magasanikbacteria bacterium]HQL52945.1 L-threonylcarbamoyladenylate synthase [Candidatus Magasanikbacteria bacterium]
MIIKKQENLNIQEIINFLEEGKTLVYPTETVYGLGCDATNQEAVDKIFTIKKRQQEKSVLMIVADLAMMLKYIEWTPKLQELSDKYWPGPLTIVAPIKFRNNLAQGVIAKDNTVAFRVTDHPLAHELSKQLGKPIVSTSANITQMSNPYEIEDILKIYQNEKEQPDLIIDGGILPHQSPSTIIKLVGEKVIILRQGELVIK